MPGVPGLLVAGRYRLDESIGQGGMGRVWRAADEMLDRPVAVKEMRVDHVSDAEDSRIRRERSLREARATARIDHPNVVRVYDVVEDGDRLWIVMELVESRSLERALAEGGPLPPREAARIGTGLAAALREVHAVGVLHRDIKPGNVLLGPQGRVVLTDFGIAAIQDAEQLTMAGMLVGSPDYMAPERVSGRPQGPPSDLWSLGATLCAALAGTSPFSRPTTLATLHAVLYEEPRLPPEAGPLTPLLTALLVKDPESRPGLDEVYDRLNETAAPPTLLDLPGGQSFSRAERVGTPRTSEALTSLPPPETPLPPEEPAPRKRPRTPLLAGAVLALAAAATATALVLQRQDDHGTPTPTTPPPTVAGTSRPQSPPQSPTRSGSPAPTLAPGSRDETGFAWVPPAGWTRSAKSPSNVHYHAPDGTQEIAASYALARGGDLLTQWQEAERGQDDVPGYGNIRLERTTFRGAPAVIWEYRFTQGGDAWLARQLGFTSGGKSYQLNVWYAAAVRTAALAAYERVTDSFVPL
ncbi:serine/threonine-protein kinase [Streptomyces sp. NPDC001941]|uniref:serine/threonine-protein kinase n=1 Tax=Streptomyces sp. NPDC001941 TaxID=3154659 RepID=UPI00332D6B74